MSSKTYRNILQVGVGAIIVFAPLARGAVRIWSITPIELMVSVLVFLWFWRVNNSVQSRALQKTALDKPILAFVILAVISCIFSIYKYASIMEMLRLLTMIGVFYLVVNNFNRWMSLRLATLVIIMGTGMSLFGLAQYFCGLEHSWWDPDMFLASTYVNHNHFAGYLEMAIPLAIGILLVQSSKFKVQSYKILANAGLITALIIMFAALVFSQSRGAWICLTISLVVMNMVLIRKKVLRKESLLIFLLFIMLGVVYIYSGYDTAAKRLCSIGEINDRSLDGRIKIWHGSIRMIKDNFLIGTGIGTFVRGFPQYRPEGLQSRAYYAHNDYLHMMAEMGILALLPMLWMIWVVTAGGIKWQYKPQGPESKINFGLIQGVVLGGAVGILSLALHGLVDFNFHIPANMFVVACLAGIIMRRVNKAGREDIRDAKRT